MKDIQSRADIIVLIDQFYGRVVEDELIGHFFTSVVELDWEKHKPVMCDFWETTLLGQMKYKGNPMLKHLELNEKEPMTPEHFDRWLMLWETTITENFSGEKAEDAIKRANQIGGLMKFKVQQQAKK